MLLTLTQQCVTQQYRLGQRIREAIKDFLGQNFTKRRSKIAQTPSVFVGLSFPLTELLFYIDVSQIFVQSSDFGETLMSADASPEELHPPRGVGIWNDESPWQPRTAYTRPSDEDCVSFLSFGITTFTADCHKKINLLVRRISYENNSRKCRMILQCAKSCLGIYYD